MAKWLIILTMVLIVPFVYSGIECEWSKDNITFRNMTLDLTYGESTEAGLQPNTDYYFRCKNDTSLYGYRTQRTRKVTSLLEGENLETLLFYFGLGLVGFFLFLALKTEDSALASISSILLIVMGVYIASQGWVDVRNMVSDGVGISFIALGAYILIKTNIETMQESGI